MRFWDSSALVALAIPEKASASVRNLFDHDSELTVWALTEVEITSALWLQARIAQLADKGRSEAQRAMDEILVGASVVAELSPVIQRARRILATHSLRAADALQLGAALFACDDQPQTLPLVTLDDRLADAATREGFTVLP